MFVSAGRGRFLCVSSGKSSGTVIRGVKVSRQNGILLWAISMALVWGIESGALSGWGIAVKSL